MEKAILYGIIILNIVVIGSIMHNKVKDFIDGRMGAHMMEIGLMEICMG